MIIDSHVHMIMEKVYIKRMIKEMDKIGVGKVCLPAGQSNIKFRGSRMASNEQLIEAYHKFPDLIIPFGFI